MMLAVVGALLAGTVVLFAFGNALGAKGRHQRAVDLAAVSAAQVMRELYPRLFEPPFLEPDVPNPRHLEQKAYLELARAAAVRGGQRNGVRVRPEDVRFPSDGFAPTRVTVEVRGEARVGIGGERRSRVPVRASATAEVSPGPGSGLQASASGGGYDGPLAYRQGKPMPHLFSALESRAALVQIQLDGGGEASGVRASPEQPGHAEPRDERKQPQQAQEQRLAAR